ncbi:ABC transporter permease [Aliidongia dinghuensis]|nr:ABC transporter permease [Aliidongia dinghuensis]
MLGSLPRFLAGAWLSLELIALSLVAGAVLSVPIAFARVSPRRALWMPAFGYIFCLRGTPLLVQLYLIYYGAGQFAWVHASPLWPILRQPFSCAVIAFALNTAAYQAEILRGGIMAVPTGEVEAARALGMSHWLILRKIVLPQALRLTLPAYGNEIILVVKSSSLASTITLLDITGVARSIVAESFAVYEAFLDAGAVYLILTFCITRAVALAEGRLMRHLRPEDQAAAPTLEPYGV